MRKRDRLLLFNFILKTVATTIIATVLFMVVVLSMDFNILSSSSNPYLKQFSKTIFMESFGFFTKSPKHDEPFSIYQIDSIGNTQKLNLRNNTGFNLFGLSRKNRVRLVEIGSITQSFKENEWTEINSDDFSVQLESLSDTLKYVDRCLQLKVLKKGKYIISKSKPIPWEWSRFKKNKVIKYVACNIEPCGKNQ